MPPRVTNRELKKSIDDLGSVLSKLNNSIDTLTKAQTSPPGRTSKSRDRIPPTVVSRLADSLQKISFSLGIGGARAFATQRENIASRALRQMDFASQLREFNKFSRKFADEIKAAGKETRRDQLRKELKFGLSVQRFTEALVLSTIALMGLRKIMIGMQRELGGVTTGQAIGTLLGTFKESLVSLLGDFFVTPGELRRTQMFASQEFGGLLTNREARRISTTALQFGITPSQSIQLERALQGTGRSAESVLRAFHSVGVVSAVAADELAKSADAIALSGDNFNERIVQSIKNAKLLGLEFDKMEGTLTQFSTDFSGTVRGFAELRSILPQFSVGFGQLLETSLFGTTDEFVQQIRQGLISAGITDVSQLSRAQVELFRRATGFGGAELQRILEGNQLEMQELDGIRNEILTSIWQTLITGFSTLAIVASAMTAMLAVQTTISSSIFRNLFSTAGWGRTAGILGSRGLVGASTLGGSLAMGGIAAGQMGMARPKATGISAAGGAIIGMQVGAGIGSTFGGLGAIPGGAIGALVGGLGAGALSWFTHPEQRKFNDFILRPGRPPISFNPSDTVVGVKDSSMLGNTAAVEKKLDMILHANNALLSVFEEGAVVNLRGFDKAVIRRGETAIRTA